MMHFVTKIGRNDPCPCGSGKKYKRCCLVDVEVARGRALHPPIPKPTEPVWVIEDDGLDELSNSVIELVRARRFDDAMAACRRLLEDFPDVVDGFEHSGLLFEAMGEHDRAAEFYRLALDFVTHPDRIEDYDPENIDWYREKLTTEERLAAAAVRASHADPKRAP